MNYLIYLLQYSNKQNKLFAIEKNGMLILPIFNDIQIAEKYKNRVFEISQENLSQEEEKIELVISIGSDKEKAKELLKGLYSEYHLRHYYLNPIEPSEKDPLTLPLADLILDLEGNKD